VLYPAASVNNVQVSGPTNLKPRSRLTTNTSGRLRFCLNTKHVNCDTRRSSNVTVFPLPTVLVRFDAGVSSCVTDVSGGTWPWDARGGTVRMHSSDPLFQVELSGHGTVLKVALGFMTISGKSGDANSVLVGPSEQVTVPPNGDPLQPTPLFLSADDQAILADLATQLPPADFSRPSASTSRALATIFKTKTLNLGIDKPRTADAGTTTFTQGLFGFLAKAWNVKLRPLAFSGRASALSLARKGAMLVSPDRATLGKLALPLFTDSKHTTWFVATGADKTFLNALQQFLATALNRAQYAAYYTQAFGVAPDYTPLKHTFLPTLP
jgi:hypothetical protein